MYTPQAGDTLLSAFTFTDSDGTQVIIRSLGRCIEVQGTLAIDFGQVIPIHNGQPYPNILDIDGLMSAHLDHMTLCIVIDRTIHDTIASTADGGTFQSDAIPFDNTMAIPLTTPTYVAIKQQRRPGETWDHMMLRLFRHLSH